MTRASWVVVAIAFAATAGCSSGNDDDASPSTSAAALGDAVDADDPAPTSTSTTESGSTSPETSAAPTENPTTTTPGTSVRPTTEEGVALPAGDEPDVLGPLGSTEVELDTDDGTVQIGSGEVPDVVPAEFPVPADLEVQLASDIGDQAGFSGVSELTFDELVEFYGTGLPAAGYQVSEDQFIAGTVAVFGFDGPAGSGQVAISSAPGAGRSVLVTFER